MMTLQQIFDTVATHLLTQNGKSEMEVSPSQPPICRYRGEEGRKCAVGALITDECYADTLEGRRVTTVQVLKALMCSGVFDTGRSIPQKHLDLLDQLQSLHDSYPPVTWARELARIAELYFLEASVISQ